jgi:subtilisin family serine protease
VIRDMGSRIIDGTRTPGFYSVTVPSGRGLFATIRDFNARPEVEFAVPSLLAETFAAETRQTVACSPRSEIKPGPKRRATEAEARREPCFDKLWALKNDGQTIGNIKGTAGADIDALGAWRITLGSPRVVIAIVDGAVDIDHPDLVPNLLQRGNEHESNLPGSVPGSLTSERHGTQVCGVVAAALNGVGVAGVAPRCRLLPLRVELNGLLKTRADAIYQVAKRALKDQRRRYVINLSWVMPCDYTGVRRAVDKALRAGAVVVAGVGQSKSSEDGMDMSKKPPTFPASYRGVLAVTATDQDDRKGKIVDFGRRVDLCAPGANICTTDLGGGYCLTSGNSFAAAYVSGLAALLWSLDLGLENFTIRRLLKQSADSIDKLNPGLEGKLGAGRINARAAVCATVALVNRGARRRSIVQPLATMREDEVEPLSRLA